ncbi:MAG: alpha-2-macroglobulin family protein [bacterium]|nr:alpha-2-macroglobulin family protein [bacterium]
MFKKLNFILDHKRYYIGLAIILGISLIYAGYGLLNRSPGSTPLFTKTVIANLSLKPLKTNTFGMEKDSEILLASQTSININSIRKNLNIEPPIDYEISKRASNEVLIKFSEPLDENEVYKFSLKGNDGLDRDYSWAYQVRAPFQVISSIPAEKATYVKKNTVIEFTTNREGFDNPSKFIKFEPPINFAVEENGKSIIVKPQQSQMENSKIYKVSLLKGLKVKETNEELMEDYSTEFFTEPLEETRRDFNFNQDFYEVNLTEKPLLEVSAESSVGKTVKLSLYKFTDPIKFSEAYNDLIGKRSWSYYVSVDSTKLAKYNSNKLSELSLPVISKGSSEYIELTNPLPNAYYLLIGQLGNSISGAVLQSTKTISFLSLSPTKSLVWLNDLSTKKPLTGKTFSLLGGDQIGKTDEKGILLFETPNKIKAELEVSGQSGYTFLCADTGETVPLLIPSEKIVGYSRVNNSYKYNSFIAVDRPIYKKTDKVNFWGVLKDRTGIPVTNVKMELGSYNTERPFYQKNLQISNYGTFGDSLEFQDLAPGNYYLNLCVSDKCIATSVISVATYVKPAYKLKTTPNKEAIYSGDVVNFTVKAELFDGTPVPNTDIKYRGSGSYGTSDLTGVAKTNSNGEANFALKPVYTDKENYPHLYSIEVSPVNAEESDINDYTYIYVFQSSVLLTADAEKDKLKIEANNVVLDKTNYLGSAVPDQKINGTIYWQEDVKTPGGEVYNPITKLMEVRYNYSTVEHKIKEFSVTTKSDGRAIYDLNDLDKNKNYKIILSTSDKTGRVTEDQVYYRQSLNSNYTDDFLKLEDTEDSIEGSSKKYKVGESTLLKLKHNSRVLPAESSYLFFSAQNGLVSYQASSRPQYSRTFTQNDVPNVSVAGVWFDNQYLYQSNIVNLVFDQNEKKLTISVKSDKEKYKPREVVKLDIQVKDPNGQGKKAQLNLGIIDDALNSVTREYYKDDILNSIYRYIYANFTSRSSHKSLLSQDGGKGGGGGDELRSEIIDLAYWGTIETDNNGKAHIEFKLPDNITSFRASAYAVSQDLYAGQDESLITVTKPLIVDATLNQTYLEGDQVTLKMRAFGATDSQTKFSATAGSLKVNEKNIGADQNGNVYIKLGKLPVGKHNIIVTAQNGENVDRLLKKIEVVKSYYSVTKQNYYELTDKLNEFDIDPNGRTKLVFVDQGKGEALYYLNGLYYQTGERSDQIVTRNVASDLLKSAFQQDNISPFTSINNYQRENGGIALLPYGGDNLELTAKLVDLGADVDRVKVINYLTKSLTDAKTDTDRRAMALYGLASLDQPFLDKLQTMKKIDLTLLQANYTALGLIKLGDFEGAREVYTSKIVPNLVQSGKFIKAKEENENKQIKLSADSAIVATELNTAEAPSLRRFIRSYNLTDDLLVMEKALIARALSSKPAEQASYGYELNGKVTTTILDPGKSSSLSLTSQQVKQIKFSNIKGNIGLISTYSIYQKPSSAQLNKKLTLTRKYLKNGSPASTFNEGDVIEIQLSATVPNKNDSIYIIEDYLPSGLKLFTGLEMYTKEGIARPFQVDGQEVKFMLFNDKSQKTINYKARVVSKGTFKAEAATLMSGKNTADLTISGENTITIK